MPSNKVPTLSRSRCKNVLHFSVENSGKVKLPIMLWGYHGIGKTQLVKDVAEDMGYNLTILHLATQDIIDLIGRPINVLDVVDGKEVQVQYWCIPNWLHEARKLSAENGKPTIFFLDEFNRGPRIVLNAMLPFLIEGILHTHKINEKDAIVAACNPPSDDYDVNELTDKAQLDRLGHLILKTSTAEYVDYLKESGMDKTTIDVISANPDLVSVPSIDPDIDLKASMRSVDYVMRIVGKKNNKWLKDNAEDILYAYLGEEFTEKWITSRVRYNELITMEMIFDFDNYEEEIIDAITSDIQNIKTVNTSVLENVINNIMSHLNDQGGLAKKDIDWFTKFLSIDIIPGDDIKKIMNSDIVFKSILDPKINNLFNNYVERESENSIALW